MVDKEHLLTTQQMARFVADGFLRFDELVPPELNKAACAEMEKGEIPRARGGLNLSELWQDQAIGHPEFGGAGATIRSSRSAYGAGQ
jgi:hypothetical protein